MAINIVHGGENRFTGTAGSGGVTSGDMVTWSSGTLIKAGDGTAICGIALNTAAQYATVTVIDAPAVVRINAASGVNFGPGDFAYVASVTTLDAGSSTNKSAGVIVNTDPAEASVCEVSITTVSSGQLTHA